MIFSTSNREVEISKANDDSYFKKSDVVGIFSDLHPLDYNGKAYLTQIMELPTYSADGDLISRKAVLDKLQQEHDFYINAYGDRFDFRDLAQKDDKARVDEITTIQAFIMELPTIPQTYEWCKGCKEYDTENHCCQRYSSFIRYSLQDSIDSVLEDIKAEILDETAERVIEVTKVISILNKHISRKE